MKKSAQMSRLKDGDEVRIKIKIKIKITAFQDQGLSENWQNN